MDVFGNALGSRKTNASKSGKAGKRLFRVHLNRRFVAFANIFNRHVRRVTPSGLRLRVPTRELRS